MTIQSSYILIGNAIRRAQVELELNQHELADRLNSGNDGLWNQGKISRI